MSKKFIVILLCFIFMTFSVSAQVIHTDGEIQTESYEIGSYEDLCYYKVNGVCMRKHEVKMGHLMFSEVIRTSDGKDMNAADPDSDCFIATEIYGDINAPEVEILRRFRDDILSKNYLGRKFTNFYYSGFGKRTAHLIGKVPFTKPVIKSGLDFVVKRIEIKNEN